MVLKDAAERCELRLGADDRLTLKVYTGLAVAYARARELDEAITLCERTLSGQERNLGRAHPDTLITRNNLAHALEKAGRLDEAIRPPR